MSNTVAELEQKLSNVLAISRANEVIAQKLFEIETQILSCKSSQELLQQLLMTIKEKFDLTGICLLLVDPTPIKYLLSGNMQTSWHRANCRTIAIEQLQIYHAERKPFLTNNINEVASVLPQNLIKKTQSAALTPLTLEGELFGSLLFTDDNKNRFHPELGTLHLEQLAVKISLCLSNAMIREQLEYMAHYDRLTGVANRRLMEVSINEELIRQKRYKVPFSVLFIDCNKFKQINDTYGHDCGDKVLTYVATQLQELIRENDKCFRYAGDEFVITLASQTYQEAERACQRLTKFFQHNPMPYEGSYLPVTISCGAAASDGKKTMDELLKEADEQLYERKKLATP
ncbi:MAG: sensor domain-containing diguanylate cyclase [Colwellia sp.]|nr:sensor domain-containing diguanylate cyclase [Colwellia sp.]MCW9083000.1 sensor domain-containing diguanylate cyclase [Colwellia sp.]